MFRVKVRELRESAGYRSQQAFADAFGVAQTTVASWEGGKREPGYETTIRLADFFHVSIDYLLGRDLTPASSRHPKLPLGKRIGYCLMCARRNRTPLDVATILGITVEEYMSYERGEKPIPARTLLLFLSLCEETPESFLDRVENFDFMHPYNELTVSSSVHPRAAAARGDIDLTKEDLSTLTLPDTEDSSPVP